ncbi:hypothetical protein H7B90_23550 [Cohnella xylanilytica]|uniref:Uncharacterized protein n=1 Tax=Cohnella xylanilytica TaxID=557555 RepID=A0A841U1G6_9BACL|nr:hypothetical protein [Cohnella xylanilytica]MBB6694376.1 hypothetical protein [Cohnella xylanilytica]
MAQWKPLPASMNRREEWNYAGGVFTGADSFDIKDNQSIDEYGWDTDENYPALSTAKSPTAYGASGGATTRLLMNYGNVQLIRAVGTKLQKEVSGTWSDIATGLTDADWSAANFDVNGAALILTNGTDPVKYWNGTAIANLSNAPKGKYVTADNLRVFIANVTNDETKDRIHYCAFQDATDWTSAENSGIVQYYTPNGGEITALTSFGGVIWAFKKDSFCNIFHTGDARAAYRLVPNTDNVGCVNAKTLVGVGEALYWLGQNDIYIGSANASSRIGEPVRAYLNRINQTYLDKCSAFTDGIRYYLNLVIDNATEPNIRLMYDTRKGYRIWRVSGINEQYRYGALLNGVPYAGNTSGQTYKINAATSSGTAMIMTKDFDRSEAEKEYWQLYNQCYLPSGSTFKVEASVDQGVTWYTIDTINGSSPTAQNDASIIPLDRLPLGYWVRFRMTVTGPFRLYASQRYYRIQPIQY